MSFQRCFIIFLFSLLGAIIPATQAMGAVSRWAQPTGNPAVDKARAWVAKQAGMRVNIERGNAWALGDFASGTSSYTTLKNQGVVGVRLFFPWRYTVDMAGYGTGNPPSDSQLNAFLDSATNAMKAGLYVQIDMMDVVGTEDTSQAADGGATTERHLNHFSDLIAARLPQWDLSKIAVGPVNEWAGGDNATYNAVRIKYHNIVRSKLGPNVIMVINSSYWGDPRTLDNAFQMPTDGGPLMVQMHLYLGMSDATNSSVWANYQRSALAWSDTHSGIPVTFGEAALGDWSANPGTVLADPNNHLKVIMPLAQGAPELRPAYWTITRPGAYFYINNSNGTLLTSPNIAGEFAKATASIAAAAGAPTGGTTPTPTTTTLQTAGTTTIDVKSASAVSGFSADANGAPFNWGYMTGAGAYLEYTLNVTQAQSFQLALNTATPYASSADISINGVKAAAITVPATGGWGTYASTSPVTLNLPHGNAVKLRITATSSQSFNLSGLNLKAMTPTTTVSTTNPTTADAKAASAVSGFSADANGVAFNWGYMTGAGAYIEYTLNVAQAQRFDLALSTATTNASAVDIAINGVKAGSVAVPATSGWGSYVNTAPLAINLPQGSTVKLRITATSAQAFNFAGLSLKPSLVTTLLSSGTTTVDVKSASAVSGFSADANGAAFNWGFMAGAGAYLEYTLNVAQAQSYQLVLNTATPAASSADISINGIRAAGLSIPATSGWGSYITTAPVTLNLPQGGAVKLRITATSAQSFNLAGLSLQAVASIRISTIVGYGTKKCVDVPGGQTASGVSLLQWTCNGNTWQKFRFVPVGGGYYNIKPESNNALCLDPNSATGNDVDVKQITCNGSVQQRWSLVRESSGAYLIKSNDGRCMDIYGNNAADGTRVEMWSCDASISERFTLAF